MAATAGGLHVVGNLAYRGNGWNGFYMVDTSNPTNLVVVARHKSVGQVCDLSVDAGYAYLAEGWEGLTIVDVHQPTWTFYVGKVTTRGQARGVEVTGGRVYVAEAGGGLSILGLPAMPVTMVEHPANVSAAAGTPTTLNVRAFGREPLSYQWYRGKTGDTSRPIPGATEASLTATEWFESSAYWVRVRSTSGVADSQAAWVTPVPPVSVELVSLWPGYRRGGASEAHVEQNLVYIATGSGLQIWDQTDLMSPRFVGSYDLKGSWLSDMCVSGKNAFLVHDNRLEVLDLSRPEVPTLRCTYTDSDTNAYYSTITVAGSYAYVGGDRFRVLNITNPAEPIEAGAVSTASARAVSVQGSYAYLASGGDGLQIVEVANPVQPRWVGSCVTTGYVNKVVVDGNFAYLAEEPRWDYRDGNSVRYGGGLVIMEVMDPANPREIRRLDMGPDTYPRDVVISNGRAYCACGSSGLRIIDVSDPGTPKPIGGYGSDFSGWGVTLVGQRAYLSAGDAGVKVVDIGNPSSPKPAGVIETGGSAQDVVVSGEHAYLADGPRGLQVLDVRDPQRPTAIGNYRGEARSVAVSGSTGVLAPFQVLSLTDPTRPTALGTLEEGDCMQIALAGNVAYLSEYSRLRAVEVSPPAAPRVLSAIPLPEADNGLATSGQHVFVGCGSSGLQILNAQVPTQLKRFSAFYPENPVQDVALQGNRAYITVSWGMESGAYYDQSAGLEVIDISDLQRPVRTSKITLPAEAKVAPMAGNYACVTGDGLRVIDLGDAAHPVCVGQHQLGATTSGLFVSGDLAFVAASDYGLAIYRLTPQLLLQPPVQVGDELRLSWLGGPGIRLQRTTNLSNPDWQDVPNTLGASGVRLALPGPASFFRLIKQ